MTTKTQELETLGKIRELLGTLDADGWVNMAFKGVCDIAENNIRDDFGNSPVERIEEMKKELEASNGAMKEAQRDAAHFKGEYEELKKSYDKLQAQSLKFRDTTVYLKQLLANELEDANEIILENCTDPNGAAFKKAVEKRQDMQYWLDMISK